MDTWRLYTFDTWGNEDDGWDVNDIYPSSDSVQVESNASTQEIVNAFIDQGAIVNPHYFDISDDDPDVIYFDDKETGKPVGKLQRDLDDTCVM